MQSIKTLGGVDVSAATLVASRWRDGRKERAEFANDAAGHKLLFKWVGKRARVCVEATGIYHLALAVMLVRAGVEVMVVNPRVAKDFARSLANRSKTDVIDADALLEYVRRMEFVPWTPPSEEVLELRDLTRRIMELTQELVVEKNRLHARQAGRASSRVIADVREHIQQLERRVEKIERAAVDVAQSDPEMSVHLKNLQCGKGIGKRTALMLLGELAVLDREMTVRQIVAHSGLDPRAHESGTSVQKPPRISKVGNSRVRAVLYMAALSGIRHDDGARCFYRRLVARGKHRKQALVAVMRKYLHGVWTAMQRRVAFDNAVLFADALAAAESSDSAIAAGQPQHAQGHPKGRSEAKERRQPLDPACAVASP